MKAKSFVLKSLYRLLQTQPSLVGNAFYIFLPIMAYTFFCHGFKLLYICLELLAQDLIIIGLALFIALYLLSLLIM